MSRVLLDTSAYSAFRLGHFELRASLREAEAVYMSPIVLGELRSGFRRGGRRRENETDLESFLDSPRVRVLPIHEETAHRYAEIVSDLRELGSPIPTNDAWIAASAMEHGLRLVTTDVHFRRVRQVIVDCYTI